IPIKRQIFPPARLKAPSGGDFTTTASRPLPPSTSPTRVAPPFNRQIAPSSSAGTTGSPLFHSHSEEHHKTSPLEHHHSRSPYRSNNGGDPVQTLHSVARDDEPKLSEPTNRQLSTSVPSSQNPPLSPTQRRNSFTSTSLSSIAARSPMKRVGTQQFGPPSDLTDAGPPPPRSPQLQGAVLPVFPAQQLPSDEQGDLLQSLDLDDGHTRQIPPTTDQKTNDSDEQDFSDDDDDEDAPANTEQNPTPRVVIRLEPSNDNDNKPERTAHRKSIMVHLPLSPSNFFSSGHDDSSSSSFQSPHSSTAPSAVKFSNRKQSTAALSPQQQYHRSSIAPATSYSPSTAASSLARTPQQQRAIEQHRQRQAEHYEKLDASHARRALAQERREFHLDQRNLQLMATWAAMATLASRTRKFIQETRKLLAQKEKTTQRGGQYVFPIVMVALRRGLRRIRTRHLLASQHYEKPTLSTLNSDKILGLFPDAVLRSAAHSMKIRYVFPNEAIIFIGCEDDEAYVLASGTADVMMGATKVFTMQPGMVFGTIGMISGEPRSASIFARGEGCMVWVM
ncbi:cyclic nucleotide-binding protein, putative, partial [Bodo saltans]